ncbi:transposase [Nonomuraea sp. CA-141351]|uniref:transposase n=1 Tax=Nonomuraea sp. CA-141351 TaxID=3239996 RepID=UPI003D8E04DE
MARGDLTDDEWSLIEPHLPLGERGPIPDRRQQFNGVMWRLSTGSPWRDLPAEHGPWSTVYDRLWVTAGVFEQLMQAMIAGPSASTRIPAATSPAFIYAEPSCGSEALGDKRHGIPR